MLDGERIGAYISKLRKQKDWTQNELADQLHVSHQAVSKWERGDSLPDIGTLPGLAQLFGTNIDDILSGGEFSRRIRGQGKLMKSLAKSNSDEAIDMLNSGEVDLQALVDVAPILKPSLISKVAGGAPGLGKEELMNLANFLDAKTVSKLARETFGTSADLEDLVRLAPFMETQHLDALIASLNLANVTHTALLDLAPFVGPDTLDLLFDAFEDKKLHPDVVEDLAPFCSQERLNSLVSEVDKSLVNTRFLIAVAPFVDSYILVKLINDLGPEKLTGGLLSQLAPFLGGEILTTLVDGLVSRKS